jgi:circadian clock protein KaiB
MKQVHYRDWKLILVVLADDELSAAARENIEEICRQELTGCRPIIADASIDPEVMEKYQVFVIPTLVREEPEPVKKLIGSLANRRIVLQELGIQPGIPTP